MEEELRLDLGPALEAIRGELTRALEEVPATFRAAFGDALSGIVSDFGAAAELARGEVERVLKDPVAVSASVNVDTASLEALPAQIAAVSAPVDVPVVVDDASLAAVSDEVAAAGSSIPVTVDVDQSSLDAVGADIAAAGGTVDASVVVDASELAGVAAEISAVAAPIDVPVVVDDRDVAALSSDLRELDGSRIDVDTRVDVSEVEDAGRLIDATSGTIDATVAVDDTELAAVPAALDAAGGPVDAVVEVDASQLDAIPSDIDAAGGTVDAEVKVDSAEVDEAADKVEALDGETATVVIDADTSGIDAAADEIGSLAARATSSSSAVEGLGGALVAGSAGANKLSTAIEGLGGAGFAIPAGIAAGIGLFAKEAISADEVTRSFNLRVGDLADTLNRVDVAGLNTSLSDLAIQVGADDEGLRLALARFVSLGEGSNKTRREIGQMGQELTALSAYLSVTNPALGTADQILNQLPNSLARGGRALTQFGVAITSTDIANEALRENVGKTREELTQFDLASAGLKLTMDQLGPSIANGVAVGSQTAAVQLRSLRTELKETIEAAGEPLIEPVTEALVAAQPILISTVQLVGGVGGAFADVLTPALNAAAPVAKAVASALDAIPQPLLEGAAAATIAYKAYGLVAAGAELVRGAVTATATAFSSETGVLVAHDAALAASIAATEARVAADAELIAAEVSLTVAEGDRIALEVGLASAQAAVITTTVAETAAMDALAAAETEAATALGPIAVAATAAIAVVTVLVHRTDDLGLSIEKFAKLTDRELTDVYLKFANLGEGTRFFRELAQGSTETATRLRDNLARNGVDVTEFTKILDEMAAHSKEVARDVALSSDEIKKYTAALTAGDSVAQKDAANALKQSAAYEDLAPDVRAAVDAILAKSTADDAATKFAADSASAIQAQADAANNAASAFTAATSAYGTYVGAAVDAQTQDLQFSVVLDKLKAKQDDATKTKGAAAAGYKLETAAGRENLLALGDLVSKQAQQVATNIKNNEQADVALDRYKKQVDALRSVATQTGLTDKEFQDYLYHLGLTPDQIKTALSMTGVEDTKKVLDDFRTGAEKVPIALKVTTTLDMSELFKQIAGAREGLRNAINAPIIDQGDASLGIHANAQGSVSPLVSAYAAGGIRDLQRYANGEDHTAQIATGLRVFAEPETGGEAYIPLSPAKRQRSELLLDEVAGRFGYDLVPSGAARFAGGDVVGGGQSWDDGRMVGVLSSILDALTSLPGKIPVSQDVNASIELTGDERDTLTALGRRLRSAQARR